MPVEIHHGLEAHFFHLSAEVELNVRQGAGVHVLCPGILDGNLPVQHDGHVQVYVRQHIQNELNFLVGFLDIQGLGEEVGADFQARFLCFLQILLRVLILHQLAAAVAPVAQPDDGKLDAGFFHSLPVDLPLMGRYIHAGVAGDIL